MAYYVIPYCVIDGGNLNRYKDFSMMQGAFKGKLSSQSLCVKCRKVTHNVEDFLGLSLEIPHKAIDKSNMLGKVANKLGQFLTKANKTTLQDCFENFFSAEQIVPNQTCTSCNTQTYFERKYSFKLLPNYFCVHFQRLNENRQKVNTFVEFPPQIDFGQLLRIKDEEGKILNKEFKLCSLVVHLGAQGGDQYETILFKGSQYIAIKDEHVRVVDLNYVLSQEAYILFYEQQPDHVNDGIKKNIKANRKLIQQGELKFPPDQLCYLPGYWYQQFMYLARVSMIITSHYLCHHGQLRPDYWDCFEPKYDDTNQSNILNQSVLNDLNQSYMQEQSLLQPVNLASSSLQSLELSSTVIPIPVFQFLIEQFGGGPIIPLTIRVCEECIEQAQLMRRRRRLERSLIQKYDIKEDTANHIIVEQWMRKWQQYLYAAKMQIKRNYVLGLPPPSKIQNSELLDEQRKLLPNITEGQHYSLVSHKIWKVLQLIYEGGPTIILKDGELGQKKFTVDYDDQEMIKEIKGILELCKKKNQIL